MSPLVTKYFPLRYVYKVRNDRDTVKYCLPGAFVGFLFAVDGTNVIKGSFLAIELTLMRAARKYTRVLATAYLLNVLFQVGRFRDGANFDRLVFGMCHVLFLSNGEGRIRVLAGPLLGRDIIRDGRDMGDLLCSREHI